ncbi:MAG: hypothetical protein A3J80_09735, partial [Desulfobacula sp. RIFOXYB2_FULL_45_6]
NSTYNLGSLTSDVQDANKVMATQKRINSISDDPIGLSQVLNLKASIGNLDQIEKNVNMGISWLKGSENALDSVNSLILDAKTQASRLINASMSANERKDAIGSINGIIDQIITLGNTQVNGNYIFSGLDTDIPSLEYHQNENPPRISYSGSSSAFEIKTDKQVTVQVGRPGGSTFWEEKVDINSTNNTIVFKEDNGHGSLSEKILKTTIESGTYTVSAIETAVRNALNEASAKDGYGLSYEVGYDKNEKIFSIKEDGSYAGFIRTEFMWETGADAYVMNINASPSIPSEDIHLTVDNKSALTIDTPEPRGTEPFRLTWQGDGEWKIDNNPGYSIIPSTISGTNRSIGIDLDDSGYADITIALDTPVRTPGQYIEFDIVSALGDYSIGHEIGFNQGNSVYTPPTSDTTAVFVTDLVISLGVNDTIEFEEVNSAGVASGALTATIPNAAYTDMDSLSAAIEAQIEAASANGINYAVSYDTQESKFNIREDGSSLDELRINWTNTAVSAATAATLGYYAMDDTIVYPSSDNTAQLYITIDDTNNRLAFEETNGGGTQSGILWADVAQGTYKSMADLEGAVKNAMEDASAAAGFSVTYDVSYDDATHRFSIQRLGGAALTGLDLLWSTAAGQGNSIGETLGFGISNDTGGGLIGPYSSDSDMVLMTFDATNNVIDFEETSIDGRVSDPISIKIPEGDYTDLDDVAAKIQTALRDASVQNVKYVVEYDYAAGEFMIKGSDKDIKGFSLLWQSGENRANSAAGLLGFYGDDNVAYSESDESVVNITIDSSNNKIDFKEFLQENLGKEVDNLTAFVKWNTYTSHSQLALEVEKALEETSYQNGNKIDYSVTWDNITKKYTIKENGSKLAELDLLWQTGENAPLSAGGTGESISRILGFDTEDDMGAPVKSDREVEWGIFNTLIDLNGYLENNDTYGIERTLGRLEAHFSSMTSRIVDTGIVYNRLEIREKITIENGLSLAERRSTIEDADMIEAIMNLQSLQTAYEAALNSTSKIINLSLADYL